MRHQLYLYINYTCILKLDYLPVLFYRAMLLLCQPDSDACAELMQLLKELEVKVQKQLPVSQQDTETCLRIGDVMNFEPSDELREIITRLDAIKESFLL